MARQLEHHLVNVFTSVPHAGSQAAVVLFAPGDPRAVDEPYKVAVSADLNLPATVFLEPVDVVSDVPQYTIRWYTGAGELPLCGHGTLAAAWVVFNVLHPSATRVSFASRTGGALAAVLEGERGQGCRIGFSLPITPATVDAARKAELLAPVAAAVAGLKPEDILTVASYEYGSRSAVIQIKPEVDLKRLGVAPKALGEHNAVTILSQLGGLADDGAVKINSRVFVPAIGLDEDTATGSAHAVLTGYYLGPAGGGRASVAALLGGADAAVDGATLEARQLSPRGGGLRCALRDGRAWLVGEAWRTGSGLLEVL